MLINNFYHILSISSEGNSVRALISLQKDHRIFEGHFPQVPIVPGVCMIQMVREIAEYEKKVSLRLSSADNIKFLSVVNPNETNTFEATLDLGLIEDSYQIQATFSFGEITCFKFKGLFTIC